MAPSEKIKFLSEEEVRRLRQYAEHRSIVDLAKGRRTGVIEWIIIDLASLGLRASEIRNLRVGDVQLQGKAFLAVQTLKRRSKVVDQLPLEGSIKTHLKIYLRWKGLAGESVGFDAPLMISNKGAAFTLRGIEHLVKRMMAGAGLDSSYSAHTMRHTTAVHLLRRTKNLRLVQKVLRHASSTTTERYADVMEDDIRRSMKCLFE